MKIIVTLIPTNLKYKIFIFIFFLSYEPKTKTINLWFGNKKHFIFVHAK